MEAERLIGGINEIVRIGDTVRRPHHPWSTTVGELLVHLEEVSFRGAPRWRGVDDQGREVLSLVPGARPWPPLGKLLSTSVVASAARLLREYHDAVDGWAPSECQWQVAPVNVGAPEVICHNDLAPWNFLTLGGGVVAFVDWDAAAPGPRVWDLAYLAYTCVPLAAPAYLPAMGWPAGVDRVGRLRALRDGYGCTDEQWCDVLTTVPRRLAAAYETVRTWAAEDRPGWRAQWELSEPWRHGAGFVRDRAYVDSQLEHWATATQRRVG